MTSDPQDSPDREALVEQDYPGQAFGFWRTTSTGNRVWEPVMPGVTVTANMDGTITFTYPKPED